MTPGTLAIARLEVDNASVKRHFVGLKIVRLVLMGSMIIRIANLAIVMPKELSKFFQNYDFQFEKYSKCRIRIFQFWRFQPIFVLLKLTCLVTLFDIKL